MSGAHGGGDNDWRLFRPAGAFEGRERPARAPRTRKPHGKFYRRVRLMVVLVIIIWVLSRIGFGATYDFFDTVISN